MPETLATVSLETEPNTEFMIGEVAHVTGYNPMVLRRLDNAGKIPASHRKDGTRCWFAHEVKRIIDYKEKMREKTEKRMSKLFKLGNAARRAA